MCVLRFDCCSPEFAARVTGCVLYSHSLVVAFAICLEPGTVSLLLFSVTGRSVERCPLPLSLWALFEGEKVMNTCGIAHLAAE